jgi:hypothetical protein
MRHRFAFTARWRGSRECELREAARRADTAHSRFVISARCAPPCAAGTDHTQRKNRSRLLQGAPCRVGCSIRTQPVRVCLAVFRRISRWVRLLGTRSPGHAWAGTRGETATESESETGPDPPLRDGCSHRTSVAHDIEMHTRPSIYRVQCLDVVAPLSL